MFSLPKSRFVNVTTLGFTSRDFVCYFRQNHVRHNPRKIPLTNNVPPLASSHGSSNKTVTEPTILQETSRARNRKLARSRQVLHAFSTHTLHSRNVLFKRQPRRNHLPPPPPPAAEPPHSPRRRRKRRRLTDREEAFKESRRNFTASLSVACGHRWKNAGQSAPPNLFCLMAQRPAMGIARALKEGRKAEEGEGPQNVPLLAPCGRF